MSILDEKDKDTIEATEELTPDANDSRDEMTTDTSESLTLEDLELDVSEPSMTFTATLHFEFSDILNAIEHLTPEPAAESETEDEPKSESEPETETEIEIEKPTAESEFEEPTEAEVEQEVESDSESETEPDSESETDPDSESDAELETEHDSDSEVLAETKPDSEAEVEPESDSKTDDESKSELESETESETEDESKLEPESETQPESEAESETESQPELPVKDSASAEPEETKKKPLSGLMGKDTGTKRLVMTDIILLLVIVASIITGLAVANSIVNKANSANEQKIAEMQDNIKQVDLIDPLYEMAASEVIDDVAVPTYSLEQLYAMDLREKTGFTAKDLEIITRKGLVGCEEAFVKAEETYGVNSIFLISIASLESAHGTMMFRPNNMFGYGRTGFSSKEECIMTVAKGLGTRYLPPGGGLYGGSPTLKGVNKRYAANPQWYYKVGKYMQGYYAELAAAKNGALDKFE